VSVSGQLACREVANYAPLSQIRLASSIAYVLQEPAPLPSLSEGKGSRPSREQEIP
jgi:hypothetical protein